MSAALTIVADRWDPSRGGLERYLFDLAGRLSAAGVPLRILCERGSDGRPGVSVEELRILGPGVVRELLLGWRLRRRLRHAKGPVLASRPVPSATHYQLHAGLLEEAFAAEGASFGRLRGALHGPISALNLKRGLLLRREAELLRGPSRPRIMVWSSRLRAAVSRRYGIPSEDIVVAPPGVDRTLYRPEGPSEELGSAVFLFVAHNLVLKNLATALAALARLREGGLNARLVIAGRGKLTRFRSLLSRLGVAASVSALGEVPPGRLASLYRAATALVHPTLYDPCSLACLEALACGCPVITTAQNGAADRMGSGREGFVLPDPRDAAGLAGAMREVADPARQPALRGAAASLGASYDLDEHARLVQGWLGL